MSTIEELRRVLAGYDATGDYWTAVCRTAEEERRAETWSECNAYSERLEEHAHAFAHLVRQLLEEED